MSIKAAYNFVPLNETVVQPDWGSLIYHDVPFEDGISGSIKLHIEAQTDIFVRNGGESNNEENTHVFNFSQDSKGRYFLPGSTLKGAFRSVLEAMSFGKMNRVNDDRFSFRDFYNREYKDGLLGESQNVEMGWLRRVKDEEGDYTYELRVPKKEDYAVDNRIRHSDISREIDVKFRTNGFRNRDNWRKAKNTSGTAKYYALLGNERPYDSDGRLHQKLVRGNRVMVFTGQTSASDIRRGKTRGKSKEFLFMNPENPQNEFQDLSIEKRKVDTFLKAYDKDNNDLNREGSTWEYWKPYFLKGQYIPVFFLASSETEIDHFGLSMLYKLPYEYGIKELINEFHEFDANRPDLAECIFGYNQTGTKEDKPILKGRVHIGHAFEAAGTQPSKLLFKKVLGAPKASFYPYYLEQDNHPTTRNYNTYNKKVKIKGRKRYPVHQTFDATLGDADPRTQKKIMTQFRPLPAKTVFTTSIRFHNLRPVELGALLSAITFHNTEDCLHSIGMGKALGLGACKVTIEEFNNHNKEALMATFEGYMDKCLPQAWHTTPQIKELINMAIAQSSNQDLAHPTLNEFRDIKRSRSTLAPYSVLTGNAYAIETLQEAQRQASFVETIQSVFNELK